MVVDERAVQTWFIFSSADPGSGALTSPRAARPIVHLLTFILLFLPSIWFCFFSVPPRAGRQWNGHCSNRSVRLAAPKHGIPLSAAAFTTRRDLSPGREMQKCFPA